VGTAVQESFLVEASTVQCMSPEWLGVMIGVAALLVGLGSLLVGGGALIFAALAWRVSTKQLSLAEEEATLRPNLVVSLTEVGEDVRVPGSVEPNEQRAITFRIENRGRSAAHGVSCDFYLPLERLTPDSTRGGNVTFVRNYFRPSDYDVHDVYVNVLEYGQAEVHYVCLCDEVGKTAGEIQVPIPEPKEGA
jgi:hypothetical protein